MSDWVEKATKCIEQLNIFQGVYSNSSVTLTLKAKLFNRLPARLKLKTTGKKKFKSFQQAQEPCK